MIDDIGRLLELGLNTQKSHPWRPYWRAEMENVTVFTRDRFFLDPNLTQKCINYPKTKFGTKQHNL